MAEADVEVRVDTTQLDEAMELAERLGKKLKQIEAAMEELDKHMRMCKRGLESLSGRLDDLNYNR